MSCNLEANCDGSGPGGCFIGCCDVTCPPDDLCSSIEIKYRVGSANQNCACPQSPFKKMFGFFFKSKKQQIQILRTKKIQVQESEIINNSKTKINLPPMPSFTLDQKTIKPNYIKPEPKLKSKIKKNYKSEEEENNFLFALGCTVPCADLTVTITTSNSCGISLSGKVGGSKCCCVHGEGKVYASLSGGACEASLSWTEQEVENGGEVQLPSVSLGDDCCELSECSRECIHNAPLWKKRLVGNKLKIRLNKKEFIKRLNKIRKIRINSRKLKKR